MADSAYPCQTKSFQKRYCRGPLSGISVIQPACQSLPDQTVVNNPAYVSDLGSSFWTYQVMIDCSICSHEIQQTAIPVCKYIQRNMIKVFELVNGTLRFELVPFSLQKKDCYFGIAPIGFNWLIIENKNGYDYGVTVTYLLEIVGDYIPQPEPVKIKTSRSILAFGFRGPVVPACNPKDQLTVTKKCGVSIQSNQAVLNYYINVINTGNSALNHVKIYDLIHIPLPLKYGKVMVHPPTFTVNTGIEGQILIEGDLGQIKEGQIVPIACTIPILSTEYPESYIIHNTVQAYAQGTQTHASCSIVLDAVKLSASNHSMISEGNKGTFTITIINMDYSPDTVVDFEGHFTIPDGLTLKFTDFGGCCAEFFHGGGNVPLQTELTGPADICFTCKNLRVPLDGCARKTIAFMVISNTIPGESTIQNTLSEIKLSDPAAQILLSTGQLPVKSTIDVHYTINCR